MPELPEVEQSRGLLERACVGATVTRAEISEDDKVFVGAPASAFRDALVGAKVLGAHRLGKHLWLSLSTKPWLHVHLGMTGSWVVRGSGATQYKSFSVDSSWPPRFAKLVLGMDSGAELAFADPRRFARVRLSHDPAAEPPISLLRGDPLLAPLGRDAFAALLLQRNVPLKALLLDQAVCAGVGNWVADEALYQARLHPETRCSQLGEAEACALYDAVQSVCRVAVAADADASRFPPDWLFHVRWGKKAGSLNGHSLAFVTVGGRTSAYVPHVQKKGGAGGEGEAGGEKRPAEAAEAAEAVEAGGPKRVKAAKKPAAAVAAAVVAVAVAPRKGGRASARLLAAGVR